MTATPVLTPNPNADACTCPQYEADCPECQTELDAEVDALHGPCFEAVARLTDGISQITQHGALWLNPDAASLLFQNLNKAHTIAAFISAELDALILETNGSLLEDARILCGALDQLSSGLRPSVLIRQDAMPSARTDLDG